MIELFSMPVWGQFSFILLFGLCLGSFTNVVILRVPKGRSINHPSSRCATCGSSVPAYANIPVISFLIMGGSCARCGMPYSARYPMVEVLCALITLGVWNLYGWSYETFIYGLFSLSLVAVTFIDLDFKIIPDQISIGGWVVALLLAFMGTGSFPITLMESVLASVVGFGVFWILSRAAYGIMGEEALGGGDVKLMGFVGAVLGYQGALTTILVGSILGCAVGLSLILVGGRTRKFQIPFGPFLAIGALFSVFKLDDWFWQSGFIH